VCDQPRNLHHRVGVHVQRHTCVEPAKCVCVRVQMSISAMQPKHAWIGPAVLGDVADVSDNAGTHPLAAHV
jgi:hypothetical protein